MLKAECAIHPLINLR